MLKEPGGTKQPRDRLCGSEEHVLQLAGRCSYVHVSDRGIKKNYDKIKKKKKNRESEGLLGCQPCEAALAV